jgi:hypothetical protein
LATGHTQRLYPLRTVLALPNILTFFFYEMANIFTLMYKIFKSNEHITYVGNIIDPTVTEHVLNEVEHY